MTASRVVAIHSYFILPPTALELEQEKAIDIYQKLYWSKELVYFLIVLFLIPCSIKCSPDL